MEIPNNRFQNPNKFQKSKSNPITNDSIKWSNNLEERAHHFAKSVRTFIKSLPRTISNLEDIPQLVRSSGSIGANYIEANESLGRNDFFHKLRIARKEAKETLYWLTLLDVSDQKHLEIRNALIQEAQELRSILSSILIKTTPKAR